MGQALYRKYRSTKLSEIVGQEHITQALEQALKTGRLSHAYLFTGPRGTGKTSIARILAHEINALPYSSDPNLDIIEIDAASNRRIDEIRDLRDKVYIAPASAKYKVYIIDEVHMLTREAFNALLKTLEEPPAHVVFILATTDAHKLPETITSRTQRYTFRPVEQAKVVAHLRHIASKEKITIDDEALALLAQHGEGSFRDSISMLDQVSNHHQDISVDVVRAQLGIPAESAVLALLQSLAAHELHAPIVQLQSLYHQGYRAVAIADQLSSLVRNGLTDPQQAILNSSEGLQLLEKLLDVPSAHDPERYLELLAMQMVTPQTLATVAAATPTIITPPAITPTPQPAPTSSPKTTPATPAKEDKKSPVASTPAPAPKPAAKPKKGQKTIDEAVWPEVLAELKKQYNTLYGIIRMAQADFSVPGKVTLGFGFAFHQKRISDPKNRKVVADCIEQVTGQHVELQCVVVKDMPSAPKAAAAPVANTTPAPDGALDDISTIFGGGELL